VYETSSYGSVVSLNASLPTFLSDRKWFSLISLLGRKKERIMTQVPGLGQ
jgi:hypothetical protein